MKSLMATNWAETTRLIRRGLAVVAALVVVTIGFGLTRGDFGNRLAGLIAPAAGMAVYAPLDQHERHPRGFVEYSTPLDQHERHMAGLWSSLSAWLDQHERHPASFPNANRFLDQHERHPASFPNLNLRR